MQQTRLNNEFHDVVHNLRNAEKKLFIKIKKKQVYQ